MKSKTKQFGISFRVPHSEFRVPPSTPARIRTWNAAFEARNDGSVSPPGHVAISGRCGRRTHKPVYAGSPFSKRSRVATHSTFRVGCRTSDGDGARRRTPVGRTIVQAPSPATAERTNTTVDQPRIELGLQVCHTRVIPLDHRPIRQWNRGESNPIAVCARHSVSPLPIPFRGNTPQ